MKTKSILLILTFGIVLSSFSQNTIELTFTAENSGQHLPLDSILIENLTQGGDTILFTPDTLLVIDVLTGIGDNNAIDKNSFFTLNNYPNPFIDKTTVSFDLYETEDISIVVRNILGEQLAVYKNTLKHGNHSFFIYPGNEKYYLLTLTGKQTSKTIKLLNAKGNSTNGGKSRIVYNGFNDNSITYKSQNVKSDFGFTIGDELKYSAYSDMGESSIVDSPTGNQTYTFQFASGVPCPGILTVTYEGQVYNTVLIGSQCWLKENLNVGEMINGNENMSDEGTIEKYCYDNNPENCETYGGLYQWDEMMQYSTTQGVQGICPPDWHLPTDEEWKQLEGTVDSQYGYPDPEWDDTGWRGFDAGERLKSENGWYNNGNGSDWYGFAGLPGGYRYTGGSFLYLSFYAIFWSSSEDGTGAWGRYLSYDGSQVRRGSYDQAYGNSVRCIKD